jgi:hypothetical protein
MKCGKSTDGARWANEIDPQLMRPISACEPPWPPMAVASRSLHGMASVTAVPVTQDVARRDLRRHKWPALRSVTPVHIALGSGAREPAILSSRPSRAVVLLPQDQA